MGAAATQQIQLLHDRYHQTVHAHLDPAVLTGIIRDLERLLEGAELTIHEKALTYRLLGEALSCDAQGRTTEALERACVAFLASQQYFEAEADHLAVAALEVRLAEIEAEFGDEYRRLAAERRARNVSQRLHELGAVELSAAATALLARIAEFRAQEDARRRERERQMRGSDRLPGAKPPRECAAKETPPEKVASEALRYRVRQERLAHMAAGRRSSARSAPVGLDPVDCAVFSPPEAPPAAPFSSRPLSISRTIWKRRRVAPRRTTLNPPYEPLLHWMLMWREGASCVSS